MINIKNIIGKVLVDNTFKGTGFLVTNDYFVTAKHNIYIGYETLEEKHITIEFEHYGIINGKSINLVESHEKGIDFVIIKIEKRINDKKLTNMVYPENNIKGFKYKTYGYSKEVNSGIELDGVVVQNENTDYILGVNKTDRLQSYKGLSGSPIIVDNLIIGIVIQQGTSENLFGISFKTIKDILFNEKEYFKIEKKEFRMILSDIDCKLNNSALNNHIEEAIRIAGPRYCKDLNVANSTYKDLLFFNRDDVLLIEFKDIASNLKEHIENLRGCIADNQYTRADAFTGESEVITRSVLKELNNIYKNLMILINKSFSKEHVVFYDNIYEKIIDLIKSLNFIFKKELSKFEEKYGKGNYENKTWRGFMASYQCTFPCSNLDEIDNLKKYLNELKEFFRENPLEIYFSKYLLLSGKGGIGKTHSLCNIVKNNIDNNIPSLLFFAQYFTINTPEDTILQKLDLKEISFDDLLYKLNTMGEIEKKSVLICIDGLNESENKNYWNSHLISFVEKINHYRYVKLIISCRSLFISEILDDEILDRFIRLEHTGFQGVEDAALEDFYRYYNIEMPVIDKMQQEYSNPLFLKLYCETIKENERDKFFNIDGLSNLIERFLQSKNRKISKKLSDYISYKDCVIFECVNNIIKFMIGNNINYISFKNLRSIIKSVLENILGETNGLIKPLIDELISENILKENDIEENSVSFSFERFYDYLVANEVLKDESKELLIHKIKYYLDNIQIYKGALEVLTILFKEKYDKEILEELDIKNSKLYEVTLTALPWRKNKNIDNDIKEIIEYCLKYQRNKVLIDSAFFSILELGLNKECMLNSIYFDFLFRNMKLPYRDIFLGSIMLKSYKNHDVVKKIIDKSIYLKDKKIDIKSIKLWELILGWFTSLNDIYIRDLSSKGLTNLMKLYPDTIFYIIEKFGSIDDDYIKERIWSAVYASLILNRDICRTRKVVDYIYNNFISTNRFPTNVLIRDVLRNIAEYANYIKVFEYKIEEFRPPYNSVNTLVNSRKDIKNLKEMYERLYWNCTDSDFGIYTISGRIEDYGFTKKQIGEFVFLGVHDIGYTEFVKRFDDYIDYKYGSLRSRDESVERISKKYQNISLYNVLGQIYDNYTYKPRWTDDIKVVPNEQGIEFRSIDLTCIPYNKLENDFIGNEFIYNFIEKQDLSYKQWFTVQDLKGNMKGLLKYQYDNGEYILLEGYFDSAYKENTDEDYPKREVWFQIRSYLISNDKLEEFNQWVKDKNFAGRWMPEGASSLYEGWIGEYPWSASYRNVLEVEYDYTEKVPFELFPTANQFNNEKDSPFCNTKIAGRYLFPMSKFFHNTNLVWNGQNVYSHKMEKVFIVSSGKDMSLYINKNFLEDFLCKNNFSLIWTGLGEKQVITGGFGRDFVGLAEISESYFYKDKEIKENHYIYKVNSGN